MKKAIAIELLAKPDQTLTTHTQHVIEIARAIGERLQISKELMDRIVLACLLHDTGKATHAFQKRMRAAQERNHDPSTPPPKTYPHALASFLLTFALENERYGKQSPKLAAAAVLSHHSPLHATLYQGVSKSPDWHQEALHQWLKQWLQPPEVKRLMSLLNKNPAKWLHQEANYPDGSRTLMQQLQRLPVQDFSTVKAVLCLADWLASAGQKQPTACFLTDGGKTLQQYRKRKSFRLYRYQQQAHRRRAEQRLYLHAPTGSGKTEALLLWASEAERILYLLPTQATVNAMHLRLQRIYGREAIGIAHARALLELGQDAEEAPLDIRLFSSVFATPITVATLDQYLLAHLHGRHWEMRRTLCRHATVLMDEIHAYEPYTLGLLQAALERDPPARLAVASATLPSFLREILGDAPLLTAGKNFWQQRRHRLSIEHRSPYDALQEALCYAARGETVLFVVNIIPLAQQLYQQAHQLAQQKTNPPR